MIKGKGGKELSYHTLAPRREKKEKGKRTISENDLIGGKESSCSPHPFLEKDRSKKK
jgi:hypothetical protein